MGEYPDFRKPDRNDWDDERDEKPAYETDPLLAKQGLQEIAHDRGRICKKRGCVVCAPLREQRRERKKLRKAEAQELQHSKGKPCGRASCEVDVCVQAREAAAEAVPPPPAAPPSTDRRAAQADADLRLRRQDEKHRVELPCGLEDCLDKVCVEGFANERTRRHRSNRPCRSSTCSNPICATARKQR